MPDITVGNARYRYRDDLTFAEYKRLVDAHPGAERDFQVALVCALLEDPKMTPAQLDAMQSKVALRLVQEITDAYMRDFPARPSPPRTPS